MTYYSISTHAIIMTASSIETMVMLNKEDYRTPPPPPLFAWRVASLFFITLSLLASLVSRMCFVLFSCPRVATGLSFWRLQSCKQRVPSQFCALFRNFNATAVKWLLELSRIFCSDVFSLAIKWSTVGRLRILSTVVKQWIRCLQIFYCIVILILADIIDGYQT